jgi:hypothetical protein
VHFHQLLRNGIFVGSRLFVIIVFIFDVGLDVVVVHFILFFVGASCSHIFFVLVELIVEVSAWCRSGSFVTTFLRPAGLLGLRCPPAVINIGMPVHLLPGVSRSCRHPLKHQRMRKRRIAPNVSTHSY